MAFVLFMDMDIQLKLFVIENTHQLYVLVDLLYTTSISDLLGWVLVLIHLYLLLRAAVITQLTRRETDND